MIISPSLLPTVIPARPTKALACLHIFPSPRWGVHAGWVALVAAARMTLGCRRTILPVCRLAEHSTKTDHRPSGCSYIACACHLAGSRSRTNWRRVPNECGHQECGHRSFRALAYGCRNRRASARRLSCMCFRPPKPCARRLISNCRLGRDEARGTHPRTWDLRRPQSRAGRLRSSPLDKPRKPGQALNSPDTQWLKMYSAPACMILPRLR